MEAINFAAFVALAFATHGVAEFYQNHVGHHPRAHKLAHHVHKVAPFLALLLSQPHFWLGVKEYLVHLIVYSGFVLPPH